MTNLTLTTMPEIAKTHRRGILVWEKHEAKNHQYGSDGGTVYIAELGDHARTKDGLFRGQTYICIFKRSAASGAKGWKMTIRHETYTDGMWLPIYFGFNEHEETHYVKAFQRGRVPMTGEASTLKALKHAASNLTSYTAVFPVRMTCEVRC